MVSTASRDLSRGAETLRLRLLDASTAHRVAEGWSCGLPELAPSQCDAIRGEQRVSNPGCWPTGFTLLLRPLVWEAIAECYRGERFVRVAEFAEAVAVQERSLDPQTCNDANRIELHCAAAPVGLRSARGDPR